MDDLPLGHCTCVYGVNDMDRVIDQMSREAASLLHGSSKVAIIGVLRRGAPLADRITNQLTSQYGLANLVRLDLSVKRYADDLTLLYPETQLKEDKKLASFDFTGYTLLIIDDVLYTGHSMLKVVEYFVKKNPVRILTACLVDRNVNTLPIKADIVGISLQIAAGDVVECHVPPYESEFQIQLLQPTDRNRIKG